MNGIAIYVEGGGDSANGKALLRQGFDQLLAPQKQAARSKRLRWRLVMCGSRNATHEAFVYATRTVRDEVIALLVDAEAPVTDATADGRVAHLARHDHWALPPDSAERVHLMTQCMETWIVADPEALARFYGKGFHANALPRRAVLDDEPKADVVRALATATKPTQRGAYSKIQHASELLRLLDPSRVAHRCASFQHFTRWLDATLA